MIGTALILSESSRYNPLFIFASSQTVYGDATGHKASETMPPEPKDLYSLTKTAGECMAMSYHMAGLLRAVILRISSVYGTGAWANLEQIPGRMVTDCITNGAITLVSSTNIEEPGGQIVDLIHVRDVCDAIVKSINNKHRVAGEVLNISSGRGVSVRDVALSVARIAGERGIRDNVHYRSTHRPIRMIPRLVLANAKAKRLIGWRPRIRLEQGIEELFDYVEASRNDVLARGC
jgi:nucleoside-diphosphate-sugar epimerase